MRIKFNFFGVIALVAALAVTFNVATIVHAVETETDTTGVKTAVERSSALQKAKENQEARRAAVKEKIIAAKAAACERRKDSIEQRIDKILARAERQIAVFDKIADRTKQFADDKNRKPANYAELVAAVDAAETAAVNGLAELKGQETIDCSVDPKGDVGAFKSSLKSEIALLKTYKTSVKNLIVGVKSANGTTKSTEAKSKTSDDSTSKTETNE